MTREAIGKPGETKADKTGHITSRQALAVAELASGSTDAEAAKAAGVSRQTVNNWKLHNPLFIQALRVEQNKLIVARTKRTTALHRELKEAALDTLLRGIKTGCLTSSRWYLEKYTLEDDVKTLKEVESQRQQEEALDAILLDMARQRVREVLDREEIEELERMQLEPHMVCKAYHRLVKEYVLKEID